MVPPEAEPGEEDADHGAGDDVEAGVAVVEPAGDGDEEGGADGDEGEDEEVHWGCGGLVAERWGCFVVVVVGVTIGDSVCFGRVIRVVVVIVHFESGEAGVAREVSWCEDWDRYCEFRAQE